MWRNVRVNRLVEEKQCLLVVCALVGGTLAGAILQYS